MPKASVPLPEMSSADLVRFRSYLQRDNRTGCLHWTGATRSGYGAIKIHGRMYYAHRIAFALGGGLTTEDKPKVCHTCDNPTCCEWSHLFAGSTKDNARDMSRKCRGAKSTKGLPYGVSARPSGRYSSMARIDGKMQYLGTYDSQEEAARVSKEAKDLALSGGDWTRCRRLEDKRELPFGVSARPNGRFIAQVHLRGRNMHLGSFGTIEEAAAAALAIKRPERIR